MVVRERKGLAKNVDCCPRSLPEMKATKCMGGGEMSSFVMHQVDQEESLQPELATKGEESTTDWKLKPERFSSWIRLVRLRARVVRVVHNMRNPEKRRDDRELFPEELRDAEEDIIREAQKEAFPDEYGTLTKGKSVPNSILSKLNPRIDEQGLIRSESRLQYTEYLPYDATCPVILHRNHWVTLVPTLCYRN